MKIKSTNAVGIIPCLEIRQFFFKARWVAKSEYSFFHQNTSTKQADQHRPFVTIILQRQYIMKFHKNVF